MCKKCCVKQNAVCKTKKDHKKTSATAGGVNADVEMEDSNANWEGQGYWIWGNICLQNNIVHMVCVCVDSYLPTYDFPCTT